MYYPIDPFGLLLGVFNSPITFPAPRRIKSIVSVYNSKKHGTLKLFNYEPKKGESRPGWTYRASRRNAKYKRAT